MEYCTVSLVIVVNETVKVIRYNVTRIEVTNSVEQRQAPTFKKIMIATNAEYTA